MPPCIHGHLSLTPVLNAATTTKEGHALCCRRACLKVEGALGPLVLTVTVVGWRLSVLPNRTYSSDRVIFANFVSYISAQDGPKFRAHCAQPASAQISKNILRNSRSGQVTVHHPVELLGTFDLCRLHCSGCHKHIVSSIEHWLSGLTDTQAQQHEGSHHGSCRSTANAE